MELLAILLFLAAIIVAGGTIAAAFVHLPRFFLEAGLSERVPRWLLIIASYLLSLLALKIAGQFLSGWLFTLIFILFMTTVYHLSWLMKELGTRGRIMIASCACLLVAGCAASLSTSDTPILWLMLRLGSFVA